MARCVAYGVRTCRWTAALLAVWPLAIGQISAEQEQLAEQRIQYDDDSPKTILELQQFRSATRIRLQRADGTPGIATLINLNPHTNAWYVLSLDWAGRYPTVSYHLESSAYQREPLRFLPGSGKVIDVSAGNLPPCRLWSNTPGAGPLQQAGESGLPYASLCAGSLYLRNPVVGHRTSLERITDFLRDHVWGGERVIEFVKREFYQDEFLERSTAGGESGEAPHSGTMPGPIAATVEPDSAGQSLSAEHLAIDLEQSNPQIFPGAWYAARGAPGVFVSAIAPQHIARRILLGHEVSVNPLGTIESSALVYLVALDTQALELHYALGTDHPRLDWSDRPPAQSQDPRLPGPDGIDSATPLIRNGMISPPDAPTTVAAFAGGFKRSHGAFKSGPLAIRNHGSHYGFIQEGVVFSKLQPGLATVFATNEGGIDVRTWTMSDNALLSQLRYARQNGLPLIEYDAEHRKSTPGDSVNLWGPGNWSGSANEDLRTVRSGLCLQQSRQRQYLVYAYFSAATPSSMARVFQAYGCRYAMHLDMNALEHTYFALYVHKANQMIVEHLVDDMKVLDRASRGELAPRFLAFPDDRDFFYFTSREHSR